MDLIVKHGCLAVTVARNVFQSKNAINDINQKLDKSICGGCSQQIFHECNSAPQNV